MIKNYNFFTKINTKLTQLSQNAENFGWEVLIDENNKILNDSSSSNCVNNECS